MHVFLQLTAEKKVDRRLLPPKKMLGKNSKSLVERRQKELELYLQTLLQQFPQATPTPLACFLHFHLYVSTPEIVTIYDLRICALIWYFEHSGMFLSMCVDAAARCDMWFQSWGQGSVQNLSQQIRKTIFFEESAVSMSAMACWNRKGPFVKLLTQHPLVIASDDLPLLSCLSCVVFQLISFRLGPVRKRKKNLTFSA